MLTDKSSINNVVIDYEFNSDRGEQCKLDWITFTLLLDIFQLMHFSFDPFSSHCAYARTNVIPIHCIICKYSLFIAVLFTQNNCCVHNCS